LSLEGQRQAQQAAEHAIEALSQGDAATARAAVDVAVEKDQSGSFGALADAVHLAATQLDEEGRLPGPTWDFLADAVGPGPLQGLVESLRTS